jgi:hypothetical protein
MKNTNNKFYLGLAIVLFAVSCAPSLKVSTDFDKNAVFSNYKTFSVYNLKTTGSVSQLNADRIVNAIKAELSAKGFQETGSNADLIINAVTILKDKQSVSSTTNYYGYGGMYRPYSYWGGGMGTGTTSVSTYNYKDGSMIIDVVDNKTQKMIWQGTGNAEIDKAPKDPDAAIKAAVTKILANFPPDTKK